MTPKATTPAWRDLLRVLVVVALFWFLAMQGELSEKLMAWLQRYEHLQLDEMPLTLLVLSVGLAWFAFKRTHEVSELLTANRHLTQRLMTAQEPQKKLASHMSLPSCTRP